VRPASQLLLVGVAAALVACSIELPRVVRGSGVTKSELRRVGAFEGVDVEGALRVHVVLGSGSLVTVEGDENLLPHVETLVEGGVLLVRARGVRLEPTPRVDVRMPRVTHCRLQGSGLLVVEGLEGGALELALEGSGELVARGAVATLRAQLEGSGDMDLAALHARAADVSLEGSGQVEVFADERLDVALEGSGRVLHGGAAEPGRRAVSGSGRIKRAD
jgi:hypothetical protein